MASRPVIVEKELSGAIVGCFFDVYNELGYGFVESLYARAFEIALRGKGIRVDRPIRPELRMWPERRPAPII